MDRRTLVYHNTSRLKDGRIKIRLKQVITLTLSHKVYPVTDGNQTQNFSGYRHWIIPKVTACIYNIYVS